MTGTHRERTDGGDEDKSAVRERAASVLWPGSQDYLDVDESLPFPRFIERSAGPHVWGADGQKYVDLFLGSGSVILGHEESRANDEGEIPGPSISLRSPAEVELGEELGRLLPSTDRVAYFKTGSEAVNLAIRTALAVNEGSTIVSIGYHGWLPPLAGDRITSDSLTVVEPELEPETILQALDEHRDDLAAVLVGPAPSLVDPEFYRNVARITEEADASLIMDEVKSSFRLSFPCLSTDLGLDPDFLILGKAVANGCPLAILCANAAVFERGSTPEMYSTFASEPASLQSALHTVRSLEAGAYDEFVAASNAVYEQLVDATPDGEHAVVGTPTFFEPSGTYLDRHRFCEHLLNDGVLVHPYEQLLVSAAHNRPEVLDELGSAVADAATDSQHSP